MNARKADSAEPWAHKDAPAVGLARKVTKTLVPKRDTRFRLYFRMLETPGLYEIYVRGRGRLRHRRIRPSTRIVIEAFPSSGNTYCRQAFLLANPDVSPNDLCSHTHSPRVVRQAVRLGVPCIVVARDPRDAVSSTVQRFTGIQAGSAFAYYERYYRGLLPLRDRFVVAPFTQVVDDFSAVIAAVNEKYGVSFVMGADAGISADMVLQDIDRRTANKRGGEVRESTVSRPSASRQPSEVFLRDISAEDRRAMQGALDAYDAFLGEDAKPA